MNFLTNIIKKLFTRDKAPVVSSVTGSDGSTLTVNNGGSITVNNNIK